MEEVVIITRDVNGERLNHYLVWDKVAKYAYDMRHSDDEILLVMVENICIYSELEANPITWDDIVGFFG